VSDDDAAERLDDALDRLVASPRRGVASNGFASDLVQAAAEVHAMDAGDPSADPRPGFLVRLEDQLGMNASPLAGHAPRFPISIAPSAGRSSLPRFRRLQPIARPLRHPAIGAIATAALLVITLSGVYLTLFAPGGGGEGGSTPAVATDASPEAGPFKEPLCAPTDPYFGCGVLIRPVGRMNIWPPNLDAAAREARQVQLQGWAIAPGVSTPGGDGGGAATGVVVDVVLAGAYVATFDVPVVVSPGGITNDAIQYLDAGATVELGRGDAVAYQLGGLVEIDNPLSTQRIEFKRAVIYEGDIGAFSQTADGITTRVEADGSLPQAIGSYRGQAHVDLWFVEEILPGAYPPESWSDATIIGPVDPQRGPEGTEGFVLVIGPSMG
jgi:hypothetical protein